MYLIYIKKIVYFSLPSGNLDFELAHIYAPKICVINIRATGMEYIS